MKLLFTGASGFLGTNVLPLLEKRYDVSTVGLSMQDNYRVNLAEAVPVLDGSYDVVFHAAGKAHFSPRTEEDRKVFYDVNLQGTKNLCTALENGGIPESFIFISSVAVYGCDSGEKITENHPLNGTTPYALSKIMAEEYLKEWCRLHHVRLSIIRPSLIAGPCPPGNLGAMIQGIRRNRYLGIAGNNARKSVLMVQDIANLVPLLVKKEGIYNVCDSYSPTFGELEEVICRQMNRKRPLSVPFWLAKSFALVGDQLGRKAPINSLKLEKITTSLTFSNEKAMYELGWLPLNVLENFKID